MAEVSAEERSALVARLREAAGRDAAARRERVEHAERMVARRREVHLSRPTDRSAEAWEAAENALRVARQAVVNTSGWVADLFTAADLIERDGGVAE